MNHKIFVAGALCFMSVGQSLADSVASTAPSVLVEASILKLGIVGAAPHISEEEIALANILARQDARQVLLGLLRSAKFNEGKLYALCGLRNLSRKAYQNTVPHVKWEGEKYNSMTADVISKVRIRQMLDQMARDSCTVNRAQ